MDNNQNKLIGVIDDGTNTASFIVSNLCIEIGKFNYLHILFLDL